MWKSYCLFNGRKFCGNISLSFRRLGAWYGGLSVILSLFPRRISPTIPQPVADNQRMSIRSVLSTLDIAEGVGRKFLFQTPLQLQRQGYLQAH